MCGPLGTPTLLHRERLGIAPGDHSVEVFHVAAEMAIDAARKHVEICTKATVCTARFALSTTLSKLTNRINVAGAGVVTSNTKLPASLESILRSHMQIHSAEGDLFRRAIQEASNELGLKVALVRAKDLPDAASAALSLKAARLSDHLASVGRVAGRPWGRDEKDAYLAACIALKNLTTLTRKPGSMQV